MRSDSWVRACVVLSMACAVACEETSDPSGPSDAGHSSSADGSSPLAGASLRIDPGTPFSLAIGGEIDLLVRVYDAAGALVVGTAEEPVVVDWSSSDEGVAIVDEDGLVRGVSAGRARVTAMLRGGTATDSVEVTVTSSGVLSLFGSPSRVTVDVGGSFVFNLSAVGAGGAPAALDCASGALGYDEGVIEAEYDGRVGRETITVTGVRTGLTALTFQCDGFASTPMIVEVKPPVIIPHPSISGSGTFGRQPSFVLDGDVIHYASEGDGTAVYTSFQSTWSSETLDGEGSYGERSVVWIDPLNGRRPVVCALEDGGLSCWHFGASGFWMKHRVAEEAASTPARVAVTDAGVAYLLYSVGDALYLAESRDPARADYRSWPIVVGGSAHYDIVLGPDDLPRIALQLGEVAYYGHVDETGAAFFEVVDEASGSPPPGTGIRLAIGSDHRPQLVYLKNGNLVHALKAEGRWMTGVIENIATDSTEFGWGLDRNGQPRVSYRDGLTGRLRYARRLPRMRLAATSRWMIEAPVAEDDVASDNTLRIDPFDRVHIAYSRGGAGEPGYYVEPLPLDYAPPLASAPDGEANTLASGGVSLRGCLVTMCRGCTDMSVYLVSEVTGGRHALSTPSPPLQAVIASAGPAGGLVLRSETPSPEREARLEWWDATLRRHGVFAMGQTRQSVVNWSPSGRYVLIGFDMSSEIYELGAEGPTLVHTVSHDGFRSDFVWSSDDAWVAASGLGIRRADGSAVAEVSGVTDWSRTSIVGAVPGQAAFVLRTDDESLVWSEARGTESLEPGFGLLSGAICSRASSAPSARSILEAERARCLEPMSGPTFRSPAPVPPHRWSG